MRHLTRARLLFKVCPAYPYPLFQQFWYRCHTPNGDLPMRIFCDKNTLVRVELEMHDAHYTFNVRRRGLPRDGTAQVAA
jgi:hypothetical protein